MRLEADRVIQEQQKALQLKEQELRVNNRAREIMLKLKYEIAKKYRVAAKRIQLEKK